MCKVLDIPQNKWYIGREFIIPKGAQINTNLNHIMRGNKHIWGKNPLKMNLNHWNANFSSNKKKNMNNKFKFENRFESIPFSIGNRQCPAIDISNKVLFVVLANLIIKYQFIQQKEKSNDQNSSDFNIKMNNTGIYMTIDPQIGVNALKRK